MYCVVFVWFLVAELVCLLHILFWEDRNNGAIDDKQLPLVRPMLRTNEDVMIVLYTHCIFGCSRLIKLNANVICCRYEGYFCLIEGQNKVKEHLASAFNFNLGSKAMGTI